MGLDENEKPFGQHPKSDETTSKAHPKPVWMGILPAVTMRRSLAQQECLGVHPCAYATCQLITGTGETRHYPNGSPPRAPSPSLRAYVYVLSSRPPNREARLHLARPLPDRSETIRTNQLRSCMRSAAPQHTSLPTRYMRWAFATGKRRTIRGR